MHVHISVGMEPELLSAIESTIKGKNRNDKVLACIKTGFSQLTQEKTSFCKAQPPNGEVQATT